MFGISAVIALLMSLTGFGLHPNPHAPTPDQALEYAVQDPDVVAYLDAASLIRGNYELITHLADRREIARSPELARIVRKAVAQLEGPRTLVHTMVGLDLARDISDLTAFLRLGPDHQPQILVAVHGRFTPAELARIAHLAGKSPIQVGQASYFDAGGGNAVGLTHDGVVLAGTAALVTPRLAAGWTPPGHHPGTNLGHAAEALAGKPVLALVLTMSKEARHELLAQLPRHGFAADVVARHRLASLVVYHDGIGWSWLDRTRGGLAAMTQIADGTVDVLRACQIAPRGLAKIALGALASYRDASPYVGELLRHEATLMKLVSSYTGDGSFDAKVTSNPRNLRLDVRLTGKTLSEVLPVGLLLPIAAGGAFVALRMKAEAVPPAIAVPAAPATPPSGI